MQVAKQDSGDEMGCRDEERTGTHVTRRTCRSKVQMEHEREAAQLEMERIRRTAVGPSGK